MIYRKAVDKKIRPKEGVSFSNVELFYVEVNEIVYGTKANTAFCHD